MTKSEAAKELFFFARQMDDQTRQAGLDVCAFLLDQLKLEALQILDAEGTLETLDQRDRFVRSLRTQGKTISS